MKTLFVLFTALTLSQASLLRADDHKCGCDEKCAAACSKGENHECKCEHCDCSKGAGHCSAKACAHHGAEHKPGKPEPKKK